MLLFLFSHALQGQQLLRSAYTFLDLPGARVGGLGGVNVSLSDRDATAFFGNPALVSDSLEGHAAAHYQFYVADIGHSQFVYTPRLGRAGVFSLGVQHVGYGNIQGYDPTGQETEVYNAGETALVAGKSHTIGMFRLGVAVKAAFSSLAGYRSGAVLADIGGVFLHPNRRFTAGLVIRNAGAIVNDYTEERESRLPFDVQAGATFRPAHMPLRFSVTAYGLTGPAQPVYSDGVATDGSALQRIARHFNFATEVLIHRNVNILAGYNYGVSRALRLPEGGGGSPGLSLGFSAQVKTFEFVFSRRAFVAGSAGYAFAVMADTDFWLSRKH